MNYAHSTVPILLRRLRQYTGYVGCGCYDLKDKEKCEMQKHCARADYHRALSALRSLLRPTSDAPGVVRS